MVDPRPSTELEDSISPVEREPFSFWEKKQRELFTSVVDYNLSSLNDLIDLKVIDLSPEYQRRDRWNRDKQSELIESFLMNVPVPPIFLNEDKLGKYSVIDGKQRLTAIHEFLQGSLVLNNLTIFSDINGSTFNDLPLNLQSVIKIRPTLRAIIILNQSDPDIKYQVFRRLNTGGMNLNAQETRNTVYPGRLNQTLFRVSDDLVFHRLLGITSKRSPLYQQMADVEFVLRYFTFRTTWRKFAGGITRSMDHFMELNRDISAINLKAAEKDFRKALANVSACFGENAFRRWNPETKKWQKIVSSLYDTQMFTLQEYDIKDIERHREEIVDGFQQLFYDEEFLRAVKSSIPSYFTYRIEAFSKVTSAIIGK